ncbi:hypothetical protein IAU59_007509 [Kwoniella sp. CBS 9459]
MSKNIPPSAKGKATAPSSSTEPQVRSHAQAQVHAKRRSRSSSLSIARSPSVLSSGLFATTAAHPLSPVPNDVEIGSPFVGISASSATGYALANLASHAHSSSHSQSHGGIEDVSTHINTFSHHPYAHNHNHNSLRRVLSAGTPGSRPTTSAALQPIPSEEDDTDLDLSRDIESTSTGLEGQGASSSAPHLPLTDGRPDRAEGLTGRDYEASGRRYGGPGRADDGMEYLADDDLDLDLDLNVDDHGQRPLLSSSRSSSQRVTFQISPGPDHRDPNTPLIINNTRPGTGASSSAQAQAQSKARGPANVDYDLVLEYEGPFQPPDSKELLAILLSCGGVLILALAAGCTTVFDWVL